MEGQEGEAFFFEKKKQKAFVRLSLFFLGKVCAGLAVLILPGAANAQFSLTVTDEAQSSTVADPAYSGVCGKDACRASLPVHVGDDVCVLNVRVSARNLYGQGRVSFAAGPCRSGYAGRIPQAAYKTGYQLNQIGATSQKFRLPFESVKWISDMDDGVVHAAAFVRLDIISTPAAP